MLFTPGQRLGSYEVVATLGAGGMGEVYRARDLRLGREVALKTLPAVFAEDPERLARFDREAQLLAALNHPNIAVLYGIEQTEGVRILVLELVPGTTLADRLVSGPLPLGQALPVFRQIAEALEGAHEKGIVHRDLKPANVKITPDGKVKVLDFGLAKAFTAEPSDQSQLQSPTITRDTVSGVILGTAPYMSPEQARGKTLDKRTDIWSFGCVLFETLSGRRPFDGETVSDTLAAILALEPDWAALPPDTPSRVRALLRRCLQKDLSRRVRDIGDARMEIEEAIADTATGLLSTAPAHPARRRGWAMPAIAWPVAVLLTLAGIAGGLSLRRPASLGNVPAGATIARFNIGVAPPDVLAQGNQPSLAFSPDGKRLVFVGQRAGRRQLFMRELERLEASPVPGTFGAEGPFFSPDGQWLGFFASGKLKKLPLVGGTPIEVCDAPEPRGASWVADGSIVVARERAQGLSRVAPDGKAQILTNPETDGGKGHRWPEVLPGGRAVLYTVWAGGFDDARVVVQSLGTGERKMLLEGASCARYLASGHLAYVRGSTLSVVPFDLDRLALLGSPSPVLDGVSVNPDTGAAHLAVSGTGALAYTPGTARSDDDRTLVWVDRKGAAEPVLEARRPYSAPVISPDGRRIAIALEGNDHHLWLHEKGRAALARLTFEQSWDTTPLWTPDGTQVVFTSDRAGRPNLFMKPADGSRPEERLTRSDHRQFAECWTPDGKALIVSDEDPVTGWDLWRLPIGGALEPLLRTPADEREADLSPDGRWLAYHSNESGRFEIYVQPYPGPGGKWQVSSDGGVFPVWSRDGRELFFRSGEKMMAATVKGGARFEADEPKALFEGPYVGEFDVAGDRRFVLVRGREADAPARQLVVVLGWVDELKGR